MIKINLKYIILGISLITVFNSCEDDDPIIEVQEPRPSLVAGEADFSTYVSLGNSLTAGFSDGALFIASQENSLPNILSAQFSLLNGQGFNQPLTNDNFGGLAVGGTRIVGPRLVTTGGAPQNLEDVIGPITITTDLLQPPTGPFNNMGVPGAKIMDLTNENFGNLGALGIGDGNPYFIRMASSPNSTVLEDALAQQPTFFSLWIGNNDVLGYALAGGDENEDEITDQSEFSLEYEELITSLTANGAKGVVANIPDVTTIPHFTTVPWNAVPLDAATANALNTGYAAYNGGLQQALVALEGTGLFTAEEVQKRLINFSEGQNAVVIIDENLTDLGAINPAFSGLLQLRQATAEDLLVLPVSSILATGGGTAVPLEDRWVLTPEEQTEIANATIAFNNVIESAASQAGLAFVDANGILEGIFNQTYTGFDMDDDDDDFDTSASSSFTLTSDLVTGGAFSLDGVHPTSRGYALLANEFLRAIDKAYGTNFEASGSFVNIGNYPTNYSPTLQ
ncbi:SGNH/GDSL hydrolase family protein [Gangjinia marincola]|uniref:SGNH/GDSL hydrolase family protein n=1 Tax=Gangjinia marincola TaxID=578463 RepID=A0ABP3XYB3_9FLAO